MRQDTASGGDNDARNAEASRILFDMGLKDAAFEQGNEADFVAGLVDKFQQFEGRTYVSSKQLFWLRDLKDKYL